MCREKYKIYKFLWYIQNTLTISDSTQPVIRDLVRVVFSKMSARKRRNLSKKAVLKILFQARKRLPDSNPIKDALPFYWFKAGPYSDVIYAAIESLQNDGMLLESRTGYKTYRFDSAKANVPLVHADQHMDEARAAITEVVAMSSHTEPLISEVYRDAPYQWYATYNLKFKTSFSEFCKSPAGNGPGGRRRDDILNALDDAVLDFPQFPEFPELYRAFMKFTRLLSSFLLTPGHAEHRDVFPILESMSNKIWDAFAYGVRIGHHDAYYDDRVDGWIKTYEDALAGLDADLRLHQEKIERVSTYEATASSQVVDMKQHPEKYGFEKLELA